MSGTASDQGRDGGADHQGVNQMTVQPELSDEMPEALLDERAAAKLLGVSPRVLWGLADAGTIPFIRIGPRLKRYDPRDLRNFIDRSRHINRPVRDNAAGHDVTGR
jgi:hypothetical protein